jgi:hypothetical protein
MKKRLLKLALPAVTLLLFLLSAAGCSFEIDYDRYALVYGVDEYFGNSLDLPSALNDATDMTALLAAQGYSVTTRTGGTATKTNLLADMAAAAAMVTEDDLFLFYFAGHGDFGTLNESEPPSADSYDECIVLSDGTTDEKFFDDELADLLAAIPCRMKVVILDSCFSGGFIGDSAETDGILPAYDGDTDGWLASLVPAISLYVNFDGEGFDIPPELAMVIAAAGEQEVAWLLVDEHGIMTTFLLETPQYGDRNGDGYVTVTEAYDYVRQGIEDYWNPIWDPSSGYEEWEWVYSPHVSGGPLDFLLFEVP